MKNVYIIILFSIIFTGCSRHMVIDNTTKSSKLHAKNIQGLSSHPFKAPHLDAVRKRAYLSVINEARKHDQNCGSEGHFRATHALKWNDALYKAAYEHSHDLAQTNTFNHRGSGQSSDHTGRVLNLRRGSTFKERVENNGYRNFRFISENIASGSTRNTAQKAVNAWLESDRHCANLMNPDMRDVSMAHVFKPGTTHVHYWTQNFGNPL